MSRVSASYAFWRFQLRANLSQPDETIRSVENLDHLVQLMTGRTDPGYGRWLASIEQGEVYFPGTTIRVLGYRADLSDHGIWVVTAGRDQDLRGFGVYLKLSDYMDVPGLDFTMDGMRAIALEIVESAPKQSLLYALARIGSILEAEDGESQLVAEFGKVLRPEVRTRLENILQTSSPRRLFLVRQLVTQAFSLVMRRGIESASPELPPEFVRAVILCHVVAESFGTDASPNQSLVMGEPEGDRLILSLLANMQFNSRTNDFTAIARTRKMWRMKSPRTEEALHGKPQHEVLVEALNTTIEVLMATAFAVYPTPSGQQFRPAVIEPLLLHPKWGKELQESLDRIAIDWDDESHRDCTPKSEWDVEFLLKSPLVRINQTQFLVIDSSILMYRLTEGVFQDVCNRLPPEISTSRFRSAWGNVVEDYVCERLAPVEFARGFGIYTETDHRNAFPGDNQTRPDLVIDYGENVLVIDVISRLFSFPTITGQRVDKYQTELEKYLYEKLQQLDQAIRPMIHSSARFFGHSGAKKYLPVIATFDGLANNFITDALVRNVCEQRELFNFAGCAMPCILNIDEIEMLEGLSSRGEFIPLLIVNWRTSPMHQMPLKNYLIDRFDRTPESLRSESLQAEFNVLTEEIMELLKLGPREAS